MIKPKVLSLSCSMCGRQGRIEDFEVLSGGEGPGNDLVCPDCDNDDFHLRVVYICETCGFVGTPFATFISGGIHHQCHRCGAAATELVTNGR